MKTFLFRFLLAAGFVLAGPLALAREVTIVFSTYTPPYVLDDGSGINADIVRSALEHEGYKVKSVYVPLGRTVELFAQKRVDGTSPTQESSGLAANYSDEFVQYHNHVFALKSRNFKVRGLDDLDGKSIVGFQNAHKYLGEAFGRKVAANPRYKEQANQETQTLMLFLGRIDLAVMDESIFRFYREKLISEGKISRSTEVEKFDLFPATGYKTAFVDAAVRDDFNRGLAAIRRNGQYDAIYRKYIEQFFPVRR